MAKRNVTDEIVNSVPNQFPLRDKEFSSKQAKTHHNPNYDQDVFMATEFPAILNQQVPSLPPPTSTESSVAIAAAAVLNKDPALESVNIMPSFPQSPSHHQSNSTMTPTKHLEYHSPTTDPSSPIKSLPNRYYDNVLPIRSPQKRQINQHLTFQESQSSKYPPYFKSLCDIGKQHLLDKLSGRVLIDLVGLQSEYQNLYSLLERTVVNCEGNSCLIIGPRATGKSLLLNNALARLSTNHKRDFITLRLSGFSLNDDRMAVREMCRQLDARLTRKSSHASYESIEKKSISESLISLLSVMDSTFNQDEEEEEDNDDDNTPARPNSIAIIIILEEVDRFAQHGKQVLLYNLLDMAQSSKTPLAIIGLSPRTNTRELFEKRVRSRFSQRIIVTKRASTIDEFWKLARSGLLLDSNEFRPLPNGTYTDQQYDAYRNAWNESVEKCYENKSSNLYNLLEYVFYTTKDIREFYNRLLFAIALADPVFSDFEVALLEKEQGGNADTQSYIQCLSELELSLLICAARVEIKYDNDMFNFNVVYDEYVKMATQLHKERMATLTSAESSVVGYRIWSRDVARSAWEKLESMDLITYVEAGANGTGVMFTINSEEGTSGGNAETKKKGKSGSEPTTIYAKPVVGSTKGAMVNDDIRMAKVDASLQEISSILGNDHILSSWTRV